MRDAPCPPPKGPRTRGRVSGVRHPAGVHAGEDSPLPGSHDDDAWGNDLTLIGSFLALSPAERLDAWESFTRDVLELRRNARVLPEAPAADPRRA